MRNVLVALKESREVSRLTAAVAALVGPGAVVDVVDVVETGPGRGPAEADVARAVDMLRAHGIVARGHVDVVEDGRGVAEHLTERARALAAEIVVMGSRGLGQPGGLVGHSVSHRLLANLDLPVLVLPDGAHLPVHGFRRVLAAIGREADAAAVVAAVRLLRGPVEVLAVHVARRVAVHAGEGVADTFVELGETSNAVLDEARWRFREAGIRVRCRMLDRDGGVAVALIDTARSWDADLIVLGTRRPGLWEALVVGSTSHGVLQRSERPVLIAGRHRG